MLENKQILDVLNFLFDINSYNLMPLLFKSYVVTSCLSKVYHLFKYINLLWKIARWTIFCIYIYVYIYIYACVFLNFSIKCWFFLWLSVYFIVILATPVAHRSSRAGDQTHTTSSDPSHSSDNAGSLTSWPSLVFSWVHW